MCTSERQYGATLIEILLFIVVVTTAVVGVLNVFVTTGRSSGDPLVHKQALAVAESLLEEIRQMPFTFCDPDDPAVSTASSVADCTLPPEALGPEAGETRYSLLTPFDNVNDYNGYSSALDAPPGIKDISGTPVPLLAAYTATVAVVPLAFNGVAAADSLQITVTVTHAGIPPMVLHGMRLRYAPAL